MIRFWKTLVKSWRSYFSATMSKNQNQAPDYYVWIDLEMTGLDENEHKIVEVACVLTDDQLAVLHDGCHLVIHQPKEVFDKGNAWTKITFAKSGLMEESLQSKISVEEADKLLTEYIKTQTSYKAGSGKYYLAGNSVYIDKRFLEKYMTNMNELLHHRLIDVSTVKTLCCNWYRDIFRSLPSKNVEHRALSDILGSIEELKLYRKTFFKSFE